MVSFAQALFWQIKYVVNGLSKKTQKSGLNELHNLIAAYGYDAQVFFLRVLIEECATNNWQPAGHRTFQLQLLQSELKEMETEEMFGVMLCQAIEQCRDNVTEEFLSQLTKATKITLKSQLNLAAAMLQSIPQEKEASRREAAKFLKSKLRELTQMGNRQPKLSEPIVHTLLALLKGCPTKELEEQLEERDREHTFKQLLDHQGESDVSKNMIAGLLSMQRMSAGRLKRFESRSSSPQELPLLANGSTNCSYQDGVRACDLMEELGPLSGGHSSQAMREILKEFELDARGVAEILCVSLHFGVTAPASASASASSSSSDPNAQLVAGVAIATAGNTWNNTDTIHSLWNHPPAASAAEGQPTTTEGMLDILKAVAPRKSTTYWEEVFDLIFDLQELRLPTKKSVETLLNAWKHVKKGAEALFPVEAVLRLRRNTTAQLQFLKIVVSGLSETHAKLIDFSKCKQLEPIHGLPGAEGHPGTAGIGNCWGSLRLLEVLFQLAEIEDYHAVRKLLHSGSNQRPHAVLVACCQAEDKSRGTLRSEMLEKLAPGLFEERGGPNALLATKALSERSPIQLKRLLKAMLDKDPQNLQKVLNLLMNDNVKGFYADLLKGPPSDMVCRIVLLASSKEGSGVVLRDWLAKVLADHGDLAVTPLVNFMRIRLQSGMPNNAASTFVPPPPLPANLEEADVCKTWLAALNEAVNNQPSPEAQKQVRDLENLAQSRYPKLIPPAPVAPAPPVAAAPAPRAQPVAEVPATAPPAPTTTGGPPSGPPPVPPPPAPMPHAPAQVQQQLAVQPPANAHAQAQAPAQVQAQGQGAQVARGALSDPNVDQQADDFIGKLFAPDSQVSVDRGIEIVTEWSRDPSKQQVYRAMLNMWIDELRVMHTYPHKHLVVAAAFTANLLIQGLFQGRDVEVFEKAVLERMMQNPPEIREFHFALCTLNTVLDRLVSWPLVCLKVAGLVHLERTAPPLFSYVQYARVILDCLPEELMYKESLTVETVRDLMWQRRRHFPQVPALQTIAILDKHGQLARGTLSQYLLHPDLAQNAPQGEREPPAAQPPPPPVPAGMPPPPSMGPPQNPPPPPPQQSRTAPKAKAEPQPPQQASQPAPQRNYSNMTVDQLLAEPEIAMENPPQGVKDFVASIFNSLSQDNLAEKVNLLQTKVHQPHYRWLCYYTVSRRVTREHQFHDLYIQFFSECDQKKYLFQQLVIMSFECLRLMMRAVDEAVNSSHHRTTLKNLGAFLGRITIGRDQPLKSRSMDIKDLLLDAYENSRLTAVLPLACKILESISRSRAFKLPSPWSMGLLSLLAEIHSIPALKTNLTFEVEVLFRGLEIQVSQIPKSDLLRTKRAPAPGSIDLNAQRLHERQDVQQEAPAMSVPRQPASTAQAHSQQLWMGGGESSMRGEAAEAHYRQAQAAYAGQSQHYSQIVGRSDAAQMQMMSERERQQRLAAAHAAHQQQHHHHQHHYAQEETMIAHNLPQLIIYSPQLAVFRNVPQLQSWIAWSIDRAVKEVLAAVADRSTNLASYAAVAMAVKDFVFEVEEELLRKGATSMGVSVAGSLAQVMCRDAMRTSLTTHLWHVFMQMFGSKEMPLSDATTLEQVISHIVEKNMDLCIMLVQKAVSEQTQRLTEDYTAPYLHVRGGHKDTQGSNLWYDNSQVPTPSWQALADTLRPAPGSMSMMFLKIYKDFHTDILRLQQRLPAGLDRLNYRQHMTEREARIMHHIFNAQDNHFYNYEKQVQLARSYAYRQYHPQAAQQHYPATAVARAGAGTVQRRPEEERIIRAQQVAQANQAQAQAAAAAAQRTGVDVNQIRNQADDVLSRVEKELLRFKEKPLRSPPLSGLPLILHCTDDTLEAVAALAGLSSDDSFRGLLRGISRWMLQGSLNEEVGKKLIRELFKFMCRMQASQTLQSPPDCVSVMHVATEVLLSVLDVIAANSAYRKLMSDTLVVLFEDLEGAGKLLQLEMVCGILRYRLIHAEYFDKMMVGWLERHKGGTFNVQPIDFVISVLQKSCLEHRTNYGTDFPRTFEKLQKEVTRRRAMDSQLAARLMPTEQAVMQLAEKLVEELQRQLHNADGDEHPPQIDSRPPSKLCVTTKYREQEAEERPQKQPIEEQRVHDFIERWHHVVTSKSDIPPALESMSPGRNKEVASMMQQIIIHLLGSNFHEENAEAFFKAACDYSVNKALATAPSPDQASRSEPSQAAGSDEAPPAGDLNFAWCDSFCYLIIMMMKKPHDPNGRFVDRPFSYNPQATPLLRCALQAIGKALTKRAESEENGFNQRVWYRILMNLMLDTNSGNSDMTWKILQAFSDCYLVLNPMRVPNFAFAWLELISHKIFMPRILNVPSRRGWLLFHRLFMGLLNFIGPYLSRIKMSETCKSLYKFALRTLLVLLHDYPEFLADYHHAFCDVIPWQCVQIRNLILAAFPQNMKLPDPFTQNLKVDTLPEIKLAPTIHSTYMSKMNISGLKADVDQYIRTKDRNHLKTILQKLLLDDQKLAIDMGTKYNVSLMNSLTLYTGANCNLFQSANSTAARAQTPAFPPSTPSLEIFSYLLENFDSEGRFLLFTTIANHLRFPNQHTHCFSCIVLWLFHDTTIPEVREQITRVLLERLIVHRPHPWGLLITFIELIKNRRYNFWNYPFVCSAPELQKLFTSVAFTCLGQPPGIDEMDAEQQLRYLQNYKFNEADHQMLRNQQLQAAAAAQAVHVAHHQQVQAQRLAQAQQAQAAQAQAAAQAAPPAGLAAQPPPPPMQEPPPPNPPQAAAQPKPKAVPPNAAAAAGQAPLRPPPTQGPPPAVPAMPPPPQP